MGPGDKPISLFNPWSIHNAIASNQIDYHWNQTSSYMPLCKAIWEREPEFNHHVMKLLAGETVQLQMNDMAAYEESASFCSACYIVC
jgi:hypothetical protein